MICPRCNTANDNNSSYCKQCALPLSEYYQSTKGFVPSSVDEIIPEKEKKVKPVEEIKINPQISDKEKASGITWLLMWEMITWILWFYLNDFFWAANYSGDENAHHYINIMNMCSVAASSIAIIIALIVFFRTRRKKEKIFLAVYSLVRIVLLLLFVYRLYIDVFLN